MEITKILIPIQHIGEKITRLLFSSRSKPATKVVRTAAKVIKEADVTFGGVPLIELDHLAKNIYHGVKVSIDEGGFLIFHHLSNSRKTLFHPQIIINEFGKLVHYGQHFPGQWWSPADEFIKRANELFIFKR